MEGNCPQGPACSARHVGAPALLWARRQNRRCNTIVLCLQHVLHLQGPACPRGRVPWGLLSPCERTQSQSPPRTPGLELHTQLFLFCLVSAVSLLAVGLLWSGLYIQECSQIAEGTGTFFWVNFGSPDAKNSHLGSGIGSALVENLDPVRTHPPSGQIWIRPNHTTESSFLSCDSQWEMQNRRIPSVPWGVGCIPQGQLSLDIQADF